MKFPRSIQNLINHLSKLPSVGPKTAERYVFYLLNRNPEELQAFAQAIAELKEHTVICGSCFSVADHNPCAICSDGARNRTAVCVVSNTRDMISIERSGAYNGLYHVLGGAINAVEGIGPERLKIKQLAEKVKKQSIKEVIIATNPNLEGETTAIYLTKLLKQFKVRITRIARGLPMGSDLEYADDITLQNALKYRNEL
jgi:recombination protein RecR